MCTADELPVDEAISDFYRVVPRLILVSGRAANSYALWRGLNRVLFAEEIDDFERHIAAGFREDCIHAAVVRLHTLLDANRKVVSFQRAYRHVVREKVADGIVARKCIDYEHPHTEARARVSLTNFLSIYQPIFDTDLHGRLSHVRHRGVAHLTPEEIKRRVSYEEIGELAGSVVRMSEALRIFAPNTMSIVRDETEIDEISTRAEAVWKRLLKTENLEERGVTVRTGHT